MPDARSQRPLSPWRSKLHEVIFEADTPAGKAFDILLLASILLSILVVSLDTIPSVHARYGRTLNRLDWFFTILFTVEYVLRIISVRHPWQYITSFYGIIDLLAVVPSYIALIFRSVQYLKVVRVLRLLRVFRVFKMAEYVREADMLAAALRASRRRIAVFLLTVLNLVIILGAAMYVVEGGEGGFDSIPASVYWAIVTLTTVGFGDISPITPVGRMLASMLMLLGYGILAVPTGIVTVELARSRYSSISTQVCPSCSTEGHDPDAIYCKHCGEEL